MLVSTVLLRKIEYLSVFLFNLTLVENRIMIGFQTGDI